MSAAPACPVSYLDRFILCVVNDRPWLKRRLQRVTVWNATIKHNVVVFSTANGITVGATSLPVRARYTAAVDGHMLECSYVWILHAVFRSCADGGVVLSVTNAKCHTPDR
jgi:hypothetical protein